jgi:hypothetical protein
MAGAAVALLASSVSAGGARADDPEMYSCNDRGNDVIMYLRFADRMPFFFESKGRYRVPGSESTGNVVFADCKAGWQIVTPHDEDAVSIISYAINSSTTYSRDDIVQLLRSGGFSPSVKAFSADHCACSVELPESLRPTPTEASLEVLDLEGN